MSEGHEPLRTEEDVEEILRLAIRNPGPDAGTLRERLASSADELGISPEALAEAERIWASQKRSQVDAELESRDREAFRKTKFAELVQHVGIYAIVNTFLWWIDFRDGSLSWVMWSIGGWGIGVAIHALSTFVHGPDEEREFQRWRKRRLKRSHDR